MKDVEASMEKIEAARKGVIELFIENEMEPNEALTLLTGLLTQIYFDMVQNNSRENFVNVIGQCYDSFLLLNAEPEGSVH